MSYVTIPEEYGFNTKFPTWVIAYCIDTNSWFCTNERFFYYEYPDEFKCENDAINYFTNHVDEFIRLNNEMYPKKSNTVFLENVKKGYTGSSKE